jgi:hypothetical protein
MFNKLKDCIIDMVQTVLVIRLKELNALIQKKIYFYKKKFIFRSPEPAHNSSPEGIWAFHSKRLRSC